MKTVTEAPGPKDDLAILNLGHDMGTWAVMVGLMSQGATLGQIQAAVSMMEHHKRIMIETIEAAAGKLPRAGIN